jgi:hypothetical protein
MQGLEKSQLSPLVDLDALALLFKRYDREVSLRASMSVRLRIHVHAHVVALMDVLMFQQRARLTTAQVCCVYMLNRDYAETGLFQHSCIRPRFGNHDNSTRSAAGGLSFCAVSLGHVAKTGSSHCILKGIAYCKNACGTHTRNCVMFEPQKLAQERALKNRARSNSP